MVHVLRLFVLLVVGSVLVSCTVVQSDIARFSNLSKGDSGTFFMVPLKTQEGSIEYQTYANSVANKLNEKGFSRVNDLSNADYAVTIDYGVSGKSEVSGSTPIFGQTGGGTTFHSGTVSSYSYGSSGYGMYSGTSYTQPTYGVVGSIPYNYTKHYRYFHLKMYDAKQSKEGKLVSVYEGTVKSAGSSSNFFTVSECIIEALFRNFYNSGTEQLEVDASKCAR